MPEGVWLVNPKGKTLLCNEHMAQLLGYDLEALLELSCFDPVFPDDLEEAHRNFELQMVDGAKPFDFRLRRRDGSPIWVSISCRHLYDDSGEMVGLLGLFTDITERKRMEAMLRESEERFRTMADTAPAMIWISDPDKLCTFANKFWLDFTGRTMEQELGHGWTEGVHPEDLDGARDLHASAFEARRSFRIEYRLRRADGVYRTVLSNAVPRIESGGKFEGYIGCCIDITDLKRAHELDLARQKLETVGSVSSAVVHDIGNLLAGIMAYSEGLLDSLSRGSTLAEQVKSIRRAAIRGADLAGQLMAYAEPESEVFELVNVSGIVEDVLELLTSSISRHTALEIHFDKKTATVRANPAQIRQIVLNLILNASEAIGDHTGVIRVTTKRMTVGTESQAADDADSMTAGDYVELEVSDTGRGMTPKVQSRIFDIFFTTKLSGIRGLGLKAVRMAVERLRGKIRVSSEPGEGTTVTIMLPFEKGSLELGRDATGSAADEEVRSPMATILFVEDDSMLRRAISTMLRMRGFAVVEASNGSAALEVIRTQETKIDVLLLDISLPGTSSGEVYKEAARLRPRLVIVVSSAYSKEMAEASLNRTVERFLRKPFSIHELVEMIHKDLSPNRAQASGV